MLLELALQNDVCQFNSSHWQRKEFVTKPFKPPHPPSPILPFAELNHVLGQLCAMCDCLATNQGFEAGEKNFQLKYMNFWSRV